MKIGIVSQSYYPRFGGVTEHVHNTATELVRRGHEVTVITSHFRGETVDSVPVDRIGRNLLIPFNRAFVDLAVGWNLESQMRALLRRHRFDLVHTHCPAAPSLPLLAVKTAECPQVGTFHMTGRNRLQEWLRRPLARRMDRLSARIAVSTTAKECAQHYFPGKYEVIPNGVDVSRFNPSNEPFEARKSPERVNVLFVGRLDPRKGVQLLVSALPDVVRRTRGRAHFLVVGHSYVRKRLEASVPSALRRHIEFVGAVPAADLPRWYATGDIFVSPATGNESFGIVLLEAMAAGCPVVCSDIPGYRSAIVPDVTGLLHAPCNASALADALCTLVEDDQRRAVLAANGRKRAMEFAWPNVTDSIERVYRAQVEMPDASRSAA